MFGIWLTGIDDIKRGLFWAGSIFSRKIKILYMSTKSGVTPLMSKSEVLFFGEKLRENHLNYRVPSKHFLGREVPPALIMRLTWNVWKIVLTTTTMWLHHFFFSNILFSENNRWPQAMIWKTQQDIIDRFLISEKKRKFLHLDSWSIIYLGMKMVNARAIPILLVKVMGFFSSAAAAKVH